MSTNVIDQHFVPRTYLKHFTNKNNELFTIDVERLRANRPVKVSLPKTTSKIGYDKNMYTLDVKSQFSFGTKQQRKFDAMFLERDVFSKYENDFSKLINKIVVYNFLTYEEAIKFGQILIDLKLRNKFIRTSIAPQLPNLIDNTIHEVRKRYSKFYCKDINSKKAKREFRKNLNKISSKIYSDPSVNIRLHNETLVNRELTGNEFRDHAAMHLMKFRWKILRTNNDNKFITSDNPGYTYDLDNDNIHNSKLDKRFVLFFPLNSNYVLTITDQYFDTPLVKNNYIKTIDIFGANAEAVFTLNSFAVIKAHKFLIAEDVKSLKVFENSRDK